MLVEVAMTERRSPAQFEIILKRVKRVRVVVHFIARAGLLVDHQSQVVAFLHSFGRPAPTSRG